MLAHFISRPVIRRLLTAFFIAAASGYGIVLVFLRKPRFRDFDIHREIGQWFLAGQNLYDSAVSYPYMPTGAMYFSLLALVDQKTGLALRYTAAICSLWLTCVLLHRMMRDRFPELAHANAAVSLIAIILAGQFVLYDLDDGGPHAILLGMLIGGLYAVWSGREKLGAFWLGLAISLKVTPGLLLPFFLWKRQWRLALYTTVATLCWIMLPVLWMGPTSWWSHQRTWVQVAAGSAVGQKTSFAHANEDNVRNSGIQPTLMRYLVTLPPEHVLRKNDPGYVAVLDLSPTVAQTVIVTAMLGLTIAFGHMTRRPFSGPGDPDWPRECSALLILMLCFSPLTWIQHLPWLLPALYWIVAAACSQRGLPHTAKAMMALYVLIAVVLNYEVLGKQKFLVFLSFKPFSIGMLLILLVLMLPWRVVPAYSPSPAEAAAYVK